MAITIIISFLLAVFTLAYLWIQRRYSFFARLGVLHDKPKFPLGNMHGKTHPSEVFKQFYDKFCRKASAFGVYLFINPLFVITDLDLAKDVLIRDFEAFHNRGAFYNKKDDPLSAHLLTIEDQEWKDMRNKLTPTFTSGKMRMYFSTLLEVSDRMIEKLKRNCDNIIEVKEMLAQYTTDVIGNVGFGLSINAIDNPDTEFRRVGGKLFNKETKFILRVALFATFKNIARKLGLKLIPSDITKFFMGVVKDTVNYRLENNIERNDVLDTLMKIRDETQENEGKLTTEEIAAQCFIFFVAGFETSSTTGTLVLYNLVKYPEVQEKLRDEIRTILARHDNKITYEAMQEMKYLQMVVDESLRIYPPIFQVLRQAARDYKIEKDNFVIPKGSLVGVPVYAIHHDPEYYPEPHKFDPERFNDENKANRHPMAFLPFGQGPRNCIGFRFGLMQTKVALIQLLLNFRVHSSEKTPDPIKFDPDTATLSSENDMWLKFEKL
ncbi:hypothetical protein PVAND_000055 [Polypedilum vanderplanki]|uniref:Cytochrome P450 n=1 Tax=Polypedilum vanderplanki TaxID=319348 RepID=A0A9J6BIN8_POLVA|nr:hypothetical protein PVAND_000055 [Polypedilum vanderplanki]